MQLKLSEIRIISNEMIVITVFSYTAVVERQAQVCMYCTVYGHEFCMK